VEVSHHPLQALLIVPLSPEAIERGRRQLTSNPLISTLRTQVLEMTLKPQDSLLATTPGVYLRVPDPLTASTKTGIGKSQDDVPKGGPGIQNQTIEGIVTTVGP
jgi:hypothetical protein